MISWRLHLPPRVSRTVVRAPDWGGAAALGTTLLVLFLSGLAQITAWAGAFMRCGEFAASEEAFYHPAVRPRCDARPSEPLRRLPFFSPAGPGRSASAAD